MDYKKIKVNHCIEWQCPYCQNFASIQIHNVRYSELALDMTNIDENLLFMAEFIICPNKQCLKPTLTVEIRRTEIIWDAAGRVKSHDKGLKHNWQLLPPSMAKVYPQYIPDQIIEDYSEACLILDLSPKASATLSRRCLQGMIRDFWKIKKTNLFEATTELKDKVQPLIWDSIDATRKIGNIGAHMEKDINLIIDVSPKEAGALIYLIELLIESWYITKHETEKRLNELVDIGKEKVEIKKASKKK